MRNEIMCKLVKARKLSCIGVICFYHGFYLSRQFRLLCTILKVIFFYGKVCWWKWWQGRVYSLFNTLHEGGMVKSHFIWNHLIHGVLNKFLLFALNCVLFKSGIINTLVELSLMILRIDNTRGKIVILIFIFGLFFPSVFVYHVLHSTIDIDLSLLFITR